MHQVKAQPPSQRWERLSDLQRRVAVLREQLDQWVPCLLVALDAEGVVQMANQAVADTLGVPRSQVIGIDWWTICRPCEAGGRKHIVARPDGEERILDLQIAERPAEDGGAAGYAVYGNDITEHILAVSHANQSLERQSVALRVLTALNKSWNDGEPIQEILEILREYSGADAVGIRFSEGDGFQFGAIAVGPEGGAGAPASWQSCSGRAYSSGCPLTDCVCGIVARRVPDHSLLSFTTQRAFWTNSAANIASAMQESALSHTELCQDCLTSGFESFAVIPVKAAEGTIAVIHMAHRSPNCFSREIVELVESLSEGIGVALQRQASIRAMKEHEEQLRISEERYRTMMEFSSDIVWAVDADHRITLLHRRGDQDTGWISGMRFDDLVVPEDLPAALDAFHRVMAGEPCSYEVRIRTRGDREITIRANAAPIRSDGVVKEAVSFAMDVTGQRSTERALLKSRSDLRTIFSAMPDVVFVMDRDGRFLSVPTGNSKLLGDYPDTAERRRIQDLLPQDQAEHVLSAIRRATDEWVTVKYEHAATIHGVDGWYHSIAVPIARDQVMIVVRDITAEKRVEQDLRGSEARYRRLFERNPNPMIVYDATTLAIFAVNESAVRSYGYKRNEFLLLTMKDLLPSRGSEDASRATRRLKNGEMESLAHRTKGGSLIDVEVTSYALSWNGRPARLMTIKDVTARREAEAALLRSEEQFRMLFETMSQGVLYRASDGAITTCNPAAKRILGIDCDGAIHTYQGQRYVREDGTTLSPDEYPGNVALRTGKRVSDTVMGITRPDGEVVWVSVSAVPQFHPGENRPYQVYEILDDVTARRQARMDIVAHSARAECLASAAARLSAQRDLDAVLKTACEMASEALNAPAFVLIRDARRGLLTTPIGSDSMPAGILARWAPFPENTPGCGEIGAEAIVVTSGPECAEWHPHADVILECDMQTFVGAPMVCGDERIGLLCAISLHEPREFNPGEIELLRGLAHQAAQAISNARLYSEAERRLNFLQGLRDVDRAISASLDLDITLSVFLQQAAAHLDVDVVDILMLDQESQMLEFTKGKGFRTKASRNRRMRVGDGHPGRAARERRVMRVDSLERDPDGCETLVNQEGIVSYYAIPLVSKGLVFGVVEVMHRSRLDPHDEWLDFMEALVGQAAIAIENANLFESQERANVDLVLANDTTLVGWSKVIDLYENRRPGHASRVAELTVAIADAMEAGSEELTHIRRGALLHDVGMAAVPEHIRSREDSLSVEELAAMSEHTARALEILSDIPSLRQAIDIPYCHHERWDGKGYPRGLSGAMIPLAARAFAVAHIWDTLTEGGPGQGPVGHDEALTTIAGMAGANFDPRAVVELVRILASQPIRTDRNRL